MSQATESPISSFRSRMRGDVVGATDGEYDESRRVWNANIDRRPLVVARCLDEADVQAAVRLATEQGLEVAVRGGAHSMSGAAALRHVRGVIDTLPDDVNVMVAGLNAPPAPFVPEQHQLQPGYAVLVVGTGSAESHAEVFDALHGVPVLFDFATPMPYVELQKMLDEANAWGFHCYDKGCYVETLSDDIVDAVTDHFPKKISPLSLVLFYRLNGAFSHVEEDATAFSGGRSPRFAVFVIGVCPAPGDVCPGARVGAVDGRRSPADVPRRRFLRQRDDRLRRPQPAAGGIRTEKVRQARGHQDKVRPAQRLPSQREHSPRSAS